MSLTIKKHHLHNVTAKKYVQAQEQEAEIKGKHNNFTPWAVQHMPQPLHM